MISHFFIDRPIFAAVLSIVITLTGAIALLFLPVAQYPPITPPSVAVSITYPGASSQVVADTVGAPVEQQVNGVEGMLYMSSQSGNDGSYTLTVTFDIGTDLNTALVMVQNRVTLALPQLPTEVQRQGITIKKRTPDILQVVDLISPDGRYDDIYLSNFATIYLRDELFRVDGVSDITYMGQRDYSIRAWLDPQKLAALNVTAGEVAAAIRTQNLEAPAGQVGQPPAPRGQTFQVPVATLGRLATPEQFAGIVVKTWRGGNPNALAGTAAQPAASPSAGMPAPPTMPAYPGSSAVTPGSLLSLMSPPGGQPSPPGGTLGSLPLSTTPTPPGAVSSPISGAASQATPGTTTSSGTGGTSGSGGQASGQGNTSGSTSQAGTSGPSNQGGLTSTVGGGIQALAAMANPPGTTATVLPGVLGVSGPQGAATSVVRLRDVARVEMGAQNYNMACTFDGRPAVGLAVRQLPGTNALDVADRVRRKMEQLKTRFPDGIEYRIAYDITPFIRESVDDVVRTLLEAVVLVAVVVLVFLQNWRAAVIPLIAVPVAIVGTFAVMAALRFSLNNISLFGLVLAIGIVVDDAIVVVENVERWLEHGLAPREATRKAMEEVTGPVVAVALVLCAVFVPCAFIGGIPGQFFRQFAVTIAVSTVFSAINSLTLSPALAALLLKPRGSHRDPLTWVLDLLLGWFFRLFNWVFGAGTAAYTWVVGRLLRLSLVVLLAYAGLVVLTYWVFVRAPTGFVPEQDQGRLIVNVQLPDAASLQRTQEVMAQVEKIADDTPGVADTTTVSGLSFVAGSNSSNFGSMFIILDPFPKRRAPDRSANAIMARLRRAYAKQIRDAQVTVFGAPAVPGLSVAGGFRVMVEDRGGLGLPVLQQQTDALIDRMRQQPGLAGITTQFRSTTPQLWMDIDRTKAASLGVPLLDVDQALQIYLGSLYVNSFNEFGRYWQVTLQAEGRYRTRVDDINLIEVRNRNGEMVPLGTLVNVREVGGPIMVTRYNLYPAAAVNGNLLPGTSSGEAIDAIDALALQNLPRAMGTEWTELMFMQIRAGNTAIYVFFLAVTFVFLALAALYESWAQPLAVILVVPLCLLCSVAGVLVTHKAVDIFVQIGLVVLVGLACKNAILIVEFAQQLTRARSASEGTSLPLAGASGLSPGQARYEATLEAVRLRLRPILMTSFAFILGVVPLVIAVGAGAEMRRSLGTAVFSGMLGVTLFGIFLTPVFFYVIQGLGETRLLAALGGTWVGSGVVGGLVGLGFGLLLALARVASPGVALGVGAGVGILAALLVLRIHRRVRPLLVSLGRGAPPRPGPGTPAGGPSP